MIINEPTPKLFHMIVKTPKEIPTRFFPFLFNPTNISTFSSKFTLPVFSKLKVFLESKRDANLTLNLENI